MKKLFGIVGCMALLAGCGASVEGEWKGTWTDTGGRSGELVLQVTQRGGDVMGTLTTFGLPCLASASLEGTIDGDGLQATASRGEAKAELEGTVNEEETEIAGTFSIPAGGACAAATGSWKATR